MLISTNYLYLYKDEIFDLQSQSWSIHPCVSILNHLIILSYCRSIEPTNEQAIYSIAFDITLVLTYFTFDLCLRLLPKIVEGGRCEIYGKFSISFVFYFYRFGYRVKQMLLMVQNSAMSIRYGGRAIVEHTQLGEVRRSIYTID